MPTDAVAGTGPAGSTCPTAPASAVAISWEVFFGGRVRDGVKHGGEFVLNPTNGASYTGTILQTQQVRRAGCAAIETGRWLVQVSPTGFSAIVTPDGDVIDRSAVSERAVVRGTIELRTGRRGTCGRRRTVHRRASGRRPRRRLDRPRCRRPRSRRSSITVTGPSLTRATCHLGAEPAGGDRGAESAELLDDRVDERLGVLGPGGGDPARAATLGGVAVQRELADDEYLGAVLGTERFITPASSSNTRRCQSRSASFGRRSRRRRG